MIFQKLLLLLIKQVWPVLKAAGPPWTSGQDPELGQVSLVLSFAS